VPRGKTSQNPAAGKPPLREDLRPQIRAGLDFVVFPGNVGGTDALAEAVKKWGKQP
jgi:hypothetical protein